jgi:hypothetical protein
MFEVTIFTKNNGPLTKTITLTANGDVVSDASACRMSRGKASRVQIENVGELCDLIEKVEPNQAISLGALRVDLPDEVGVIRQEEINGKTRPDIIARIAANIFYRSGQQAFALVDADTKGMPADIVAKVHRRGGFWPTLLSLFPALVGIANVTRNSTSAGLFRTDTGEKLPGSGGLHAYLAVKDGGDVERFLKTLHDRCWLAGFGWTMVGEAGQLLERSLIDRSVFGGERLVFEGNPILHPPLGQDREVRRPVAKDGELLDTVTAFPPLTIAERAKVSELKSKAGFTLKGDATKARQAFVKRQADETVKRTGISMKAAERIATKQCNGVLLPPVVLPFDDPEFEGCTVGDLLADPDRFEGATLADPVEGIAYGRCKAKIMRRSDGSIWIHSFAHGRSTYDLKYDAASIRDAMAKADASDVIRVLIEMSLMADLDDDELHDLQDEARRRSGKGKRTITEQLKKARQKHTERRREEEAKRRKAQRTDPRPAIRVPAQDAPWLPVVDLLNDVLGKSNDPKPPARNLDGFVVSARKLPVPKTHAFGAPRSEEGEYTLPPPDQWMLATLDEKELGELIEKHIDFVDHKGRSVHLPVQFVRHYVKRHDRALPTVVAIATAPLVLADGVILAPDGLDRDRSIIFEIPKELRAVLPRREDCTDEAIKAAMQFLCDDWLCDVLADPTGKAILIAAALTLIERSLLPDRPAFFVTAGKRGGGKTTALKMLVMAVMGVLPAASSWSNNEEERRKTLLSQFISGVGFILWDNIERGTQISCPHIERSCTADLYKDRKLGVSEMVVTAASAIHFFNGNNIGPRGDLASRSLNLRLAVESADPENRNFKHPNPLNWTEMHRANILRALYIVLLGNPQLQMPADAPSHTRFKLWWRLVGSAVENAVEIYGGSLDFRQFFVEREEADDEDTVSLVEFLELVLRDWPNGFTAAEMAEQINDRVGDYKTLMDFLYPDRSVDFVSAKSVGKQLGKHLDEPVTTSHGALRLVTVPVAVGRRNQRNILRYRVKGNA